MSWLETLEIIAAVASILTAIVAASAAAYILFDARKKRLKVEAYLRGVKSAATGSEKGQRTILHLMARLGLTEAEILHASFGSRHIKRSLAADKETGHADAMLLEYIDSP